MRVLTCVSFHSTGSSVVDDIFKEFDNCVSAPSDIECRFLQDPDGISDLEYNLIDNPHRLNSGYAIKRYERFVDRYNHTYSLIFGKKWKSVSRKYIDSLISVQYKGFWFKDLEMLPVKDLVVYYAKRVINLLKNPRNRISGYYVNCPKVDFYHSYLTSEEFLEKTKIYVRNLCNIINTEDKPFLLLDQCVPTSNIGRYTKYFDDIKVIVVDRDPRDVYIEHKYNKDHVLPNSPEEFCKVFLDQREMFNKSDKKNVLYMKFEDFIFQYEDSLRKLVEYVGQDMGRHRNKRSHFNPSISIGNTQLWKKHPEFNEEIRIIENKLGYYLYDFDSLSQ